MHSIVAILHTIEWFSRDTIRFTRFTNLAFRLPDGSRKLWIVPGWPELHEGMKVTALLKQPDHKHVSNTVLGWKTHPSGSTTYWRPEPARMVFTGIALLAALVLFWLYQIHPARSSLSSPIPALAFLLMGLLGMGKYLSMLLVVRKLNSIAECD